MTPTRTDIEHALAVWLPSSMSGRSTPAMFSMAGIPGSGKSTIISRLALQGVLPENAYTHNPDNVMESLPQYKNDYERIGKVAAREKWELYARSIAEEYLFVAAVGRRLNIIIDMGFAREGIFELAQMAIREGYSLEVLFVFCSVAEAIRRANERGRHVSEETIQQRAVFLRDNMFRIGELASRVKCVDNEVAGGYGRDVSWGELVELVQRHY